MLQRQYPFKLSPPTDDRPFFAHTLPASALARPPPGAASDASREPGYELLLLSFYQLLLASFLVIASLDRPVLLPWAWAVNGCASVIAVALATMVALEFGFSRMLLLSALSYLCATLAATQLPGTKR